MVDDILTIETRSYHDVVGRREVRTKRKSPCRRFREQYFPVFVKRIATKHTHTNSARVMAGYAKINTHTHTHGTRHTHTHSH